MKNHSIQEFVLRFVVLNIAIMTSITFRAQTQEIGVIIGGTYGVSYKYWFSENTALQNDLAVGLTLGVGSIYYQGDYYGSAVNPQYDFTLNPALLRHFNLSDRFSFYVGAGINLGLVSDLFNIDPTLIMGKAGANGVLGLALRLNRVVIAGDFRPGYGIGFYNADTAHFSYFDWKLGLAIRYCL